MSAPTVQDITDVSQLGDVDLDQAAAAEPDPAAPYGYLKDGKTPKRKPGPAKGAGKTMPAPGRGRRTTRRGGGSLRTAPAAPAGTAAGAAEAAAAASSAADPILMAGAQAILSVPTQLLAMAGLAVGASSNRFPDDDPRRDATMRHAMALTADAATLIVHGPALAAGAASLAETTPWLAGVLAKAAQVAPAAGLATAAAAIVLQGLCNHGMVPATPMLGTVPPAEIARQAMGNAAPAGAS